MDRPEGRSASQVGELEPIGVGQKKHISFPDNLTLVFEELANSNPSTRTSLTLRSVAQDVQNKILSPPSAVTDFHEDSDHCATRTKVCGTVLRQYNR